MIKKIAIFIIGFMIVFAPTFIMAEAVDFSGLVPNCNEGDIKDGKYVNSCGFSELILMVNEVIKFVLFYLATPLFALILIYVGWIYISAGGNAEKVGKSKHIFTNALLGYVLALAAWLIVNTIMKAVGFKGENYLN